VVAAALPRPALRTEAENEKFAAAAGRSSLTAGSSTTRSGPAAPGPPPQLASAMQASATSALHATGCMPEQRTVDLVFPDINGI